MCGYNSAYSDVKLFTHHFDEGELRSNHRDFIKTYMNEINILNYFKVRNYVGMSHSRST